MSSESSDITDINSTFIHYAFNTCYNIGLNYVQEEVKFILYKDPKLNEFWVDFKTEQSFWQILKILYWQFNICFFKKMVVFESKTSKNNLN